MVNKLQTAIAKDAKGVFDSNPNLFRSLDNINGTGKIKNSTEFEVFVKSNEKFRTSEISKILLLTK